MAHDINCKSPTQNGHVTKSTEDLLRKSKFEIHLTVTVAKKIVNTPST